VTATESAQQIAQALADKGGVDVCVLDLGDETAFTDFFVIATGTSDRHLGTLADTAVEIAHLAGDRPLGVEGGKTGRWVLVDLGDVVVHLFREEAREFYGLERLWGEEEPRAVEAAR
jgi:ribosome-associated protein